ncbi:unnamed protein product [Closterium sp. NIES-54]
MLSLSSRPCCGFSRSEITAAPGSNPGSRAQKHGVQFHQQRSWNPRPRIVISAAGKGSKAKTASSGGFGAKTKAGVKAAAAPKIDAAALLRRSEQQYHQLLCDYHQQYHSQSENAESSSADSFPESPGLREYVICVRRMHQSGATSAGPAADVALSDWLPVVELVLVSDEEAATAMPKVLPHVCRLIAESAGSFVSSVPRHLLEYSYESAESFYDEVVTAMLGTSPSSPTGGDNQGAEEHSCPYSILGIAKSAAPSQIRAAYRSLAARHHPDRHNAHDDKASVEAQFMKITEAYERIKRGGHVTVGASSAGTYASLGGGKREGLSPALKIRPSPPNEKPPPGVTVAVRGLEPEIVELFLAQATRRSRSAAAAAVAATR